MVQTESMAYLRLLDLKREPFANTPDPNLFYQSCQHVEILQKLEIAIRLKRGLNVIMGEVGTGKTTLSRRLLQEIADDPGIDHHLILDPGFASAWDFLAYIHSFFTGKELLTHQGSLTEAEIKESIKNHLFARSIEDDINTVLIIDEGQKLTLAILEVLRELLNFETNDKKLLQIVIFTQNEFKPLLDKVENFKDRINFQYSLVPLNFRESKALIQHRLMKSFFPGKARPIFSQSAYWAIYSVTKGAPRKMIMLCHQVILSLLIHQKKKAGFFMVRSCAVKNFHGKTSNLIPHAAMTNTRLISTALVILMVVSLTAYYISRTHTPEYQANATTIISGSGTRVEKTIPNKKTPGTEEPPEQVLPAPAQGYGNALVPQDTTIFSMISLVYGQFSQKLLYRLMAANPVVTSPDHILSGTSLFFPAPPFAGPRSGVYLALLETRDFNLAFSHVLKPEYRALNTRIIASPEKNTQFLFYVVINNLFKTREQAEIFMKKNHPLLSIKIVDTASFFLTPSAGQGGKL